MPDIGARPLARNSVEALPEKQDTMARPGQPPAFRESPTGISWALKGAGFQNPEEIDVFNVAGVLRQPVVLRQFCDSGTPLSAQAR
jgi:hypothetical protein